MLINNDRKVETTETIELT